MTDDAAPGKKATLGWPFSFALNRLLAAEPWARERLAPFAGETVELRGPLLPALRLVILPGGTLEAGGADPALTITLTPEALLSLGRSPEHFARALEVDGDPRLAAEVSALARHLRWDAEEDLSRLFGDVTAHRIAGAGRSLARWHADAARRLVESLADYAVDEKRILMARQEVDQFAGEVARLRDALERLEKRIERLA
ncbi:MAG TPA: SCP2 sterol-binding domain-containing protein [Burkholderiales bacterium]|nr:SCP2 sterol-binding domain-containing protein [Burkholderiales bacterium]